VELVLQGKLMLAALQKLSLCAVVIKVAPFNERRKTGLNYLCG